MNQNTNDSIVANYPNMITIRKSGNEVMPTVDIEGEFFKITVKEREIKKLRDVLDAVTEEDWFAIHDINNNDVLHVSVGEEGVTFAYKMKNVKGLFRVNAKVILQVEGREKLHNDLLKAYPRRTPANYHADMDFIREQTTVPVPTILQNVWERFVVYESITEGMSTLTFVHPLVRMSIKKEGFMDTIETEYLQAIEELLTSEEEYEEKMETYNGEFDTDYAGCFDIYECVIIQDTKRDNGEVAYGLFFIQPFGVENEHIEVLMTWEELKAFCEFLFELTGRKESVEEKMQTEEENIKRNRLQERPKRPSAECDQISIFPASFVEYDAVWVDTDIGTIAIEEDEVESFHGLLEEDVTYREDTFYSVTREGDYVRVEWEEEQVKITVSIANKEKSFLLTEENRKKLVVELNKMIESN